ncbi:Helix-turn-helix [Jiangella alkaliphila]|uniref:Helix-turn-helix n=1 Tax=Jiangella alkaliphila TaxID=419479 RepID=A0A1H2GE10_9ACTN|nr:Helix-turn-helix [Jiangella alkaliphila]
MTESNEDAEITDHPVWDVGQAIHLADLHEPWTIDRLYVDKIRYVRLTRPTRRGVPESRRIRDDILRRHHQVIRRRLDRDIKANLGFRLRGLRVERDITQQELAPLTSMHHTMLGHIEAGGRNINLRQLDELAVALGVSPAQLFG